MNTTSQRGFRDEDRDGMMGPEEHAAKLYKVVTDAFWASVEAATLGEAIADVFDGECGGRVKDLDSLVAFFANSDGGWCRISEDGCDVVEIGECG